MKHCLGTYTYTFLHVVPHWLLHSVLAKSPQVQCVLDAAAHVVTDHMTVD